MGHPIKYGASNEVWGATQLPCSRSFSQPFTHVDTIDVLQRMAQHASGRRKTRKSRHQWTEGSLTCHSSCSLSRITQQYLLIHHTHLRLQRFFRLVRATTKWFSWMRRESPTYARQRAGSGLGSGLWLGLGLGLAPQLHQHCT